jgi:charged multivesicular body protein 7
MSGGWKTRKQETESRLTRRCQLKAKHHLSLSQKSIALSHLKSKKNLEEILLKRISAGHQLSTVLRGIDQAKSDIEIMAAYETSTSTLKTILSDPSLDLDHVEKTTEALAEVMANQEEVDSAIRLGGEIAVGSGGVVVDDDELRKELEDMVKEEKAAREKETEKPLPSLSKEPEVGVEVEVPATNSRSAKASEEAEVEADQIWRERYEAAQQKKQDEGERAGAERLKRQEKMAAE